MCQLLACMRTKAWHKSRDYSEGNEKSWKDIGLHCKYPGQKNEFIFLKTDTF